MKTKSLVMAVFFTFLLCRLQNDMAAAANYTLTLTAQGFGTVQRNPTNAAYPAGVVVTITGTPNAGWYFANWSGGTNSTVNPLNVTMNSDLVITGNFLAYPAYSLSVVTNGQGTIALSPPGGSHQSNTVITAAATPEAGWVFAGWSGATSSSANPVSFALTTSGTLTGTFAELPALDLQPVSVTNKPGSTVSFSAHAVGTGPLGYQWYFSGGALPMGATNATLSMTNAGTGQVGTYWVVATNEYGRATSQVVSLTLTNSVGPINLVTSPDEGSLLAAIALGGWVGIEFNGTLTLTNTISISNNVVLDGSGVAATISGGKAVQLFHVSSGASLTISNLTLANGNSTYGAAIESDTGAVTLVSCLLTNNEASTGGAIYNNGGTLALLGSTFSNNEVTAIGSLGGAAYQASGSLVVSNCLFSFNSAMDAGNGGYNGAMPAGGALAFDGGIVTVEHSRFIANKASGASATWINTGCPAAGGAVYTRATLTVNDSSFDENQAIADSVVQFRSVGSGVASGGAIYNAGTTILNRCSIYSNSVQGGYTYPYASGAVSGRPGYGGGIYNSAQCAATNCTIGLNYAASGGAGDEQWNFNTEATNGPALGGGIFNGSAATFVAMNLTIASNNCSSPAGQYCVNGLAAGSQLANANGTLRVHNTVIGYGGTNSNAYGIITDDGYNICSDGSANFDSGSSYNYTDPQLAPLGKYGGPTWCMALLPTSAAIDNGDPANFPPTDQRGYVRPFGSGPDVGAYEYGSVASEEPLLNISAAGTNVVVSFAAFPTNSYQLQYSTNLSIWASLSTNGPISVSTNISQSLSHQGLNHSYFRLLVQ